MSLPRLPALRIALILLLSCALVVAVTWFVPASAAATVNWLFRVRGATATADDVVIVAIDDASLQSIGQWPWPRNVMAETLDRLTAAQPAAIGLDVIYAEPAVPSHDQQLAAAVQRNARVVLPAQLFETAKNETASIEWMRPLPALKQAAAALGHVHVAPAVDGIVRSVQLSKADARGEKLWAFALAVLRVAENIAPDDCAETPRELRCGKYRIPVLDENAAAPLPGVSFIRPNEMLINFAGPTGSFPQYSLAEVHAGKVAASAFSGKIVLIGAVAPSLGDARVAPFMHFQPGRNEGGQEMPGVEIHANVIRTIRQRLALRALPDRLNFACALVVILLAALTISRFDGWRQLAWLAGLLAVILCGSYWAFTRGLLIPPLVPMLTGLLVVVPLLFNRALTASRELDAKLAALVQSQQGFLAPVATASIAFAQKRQSAALPQSLAGKLRTVDDLTVKLLARMSFINRTLASMNEGVLVADLNGRIVFANREAQQLFGATEAVLLRRELKAFLRERGELVNLDAALQQALRGENAQLEFMLDDHAARHFTLSLSPLATETEPQQSIGVVVLLADITKRVELEQMQTETLQLVSHELRTPLTSIQGLSDVLLKFPVDAAQTREMHSTIHAEALRLGETINRYLDLTRLESGAQPLRLAETPLAPLLNEAARNLSVLAAERRIRLTIHLDDERLTARVDAQLLTQALTNLLSNAVKYSPPDTTVTMRARAEASHIILQVADEGYGIPVEARERIFEKFYRLTRDADSPVIGTGLGLALVKEIVERHTGRVSFANNAAAGTTFTMQLPRAAPIA